MVRAGYGSGDVGGRRRAHGPSVFVGNIPWAATEPELRNLPAGCGQVNHFRILVDRNTNRSRGNNEPDSLNEHTIHGRQLQVDHARPRN